MTDTQHADRCTARMPDPFPAMLAALDRFDAHLAEFERAAGEEARAS
ncbi:hypothetical protein [Agromyces indicus]|uniref:Uncharacterized protein n=1 Tax=Agromyces indicus TaxID=758919 RepID=A0ABU1FLC3_9MICO|nr:hypothetical protein [Agromyces indicus]MDR5692100.1 hypothetical protein [Agromyces indicus]